MYRSILVATDGSAVATSAVAQAGTLARSLGAKLTIVTVTPQAPAFDAAEIGWSVPRSVFDEIRRANVEKSNAVLRAAAAASGVDAETVAIEDERPYQGILDTATRVEADLIVLGSHGNRGLDRLILGSQAQKVLNLATVTVMIVKPKVEDRT